MEKCVVTFPTTTAAMAMEFACTGAKVPGRLIPVPRSISAGCGLCWAAPLESRGAVEALLLAEKIQIDGVYTVVL
ncbi:MAG: DUF3343 domain-containing protein [Oscillibacter sp.]